MGSNNHLSTNLILNCTDQTALISKGRKQFPQKGSNCCFAIGSSNPYQFYFSRGFSKKIMTNITRCHRTIFHLHIRYSIHYHFRKHFTNNRCCPILNGHFYKLVSIHNSTLDGNKTTCCTHSP